MTQAHQKPQDSVEVRIDEKFSALRSTLEEAIARANPADTADARESLVVELVSLCRPEFDLEARFHVSLREVGFESSETGAIAAFLVRQDVEAAFESLAVAVGTARADDIELLKLASSAVLRAGTSCPDPPWLTALVTRIQVPATRGGTATDLVQFLPRGCQTRADMAGIAAECVAKLWLESPAWASALLNSLCGFLVDSNDQPLLASTASALLESLPAGNPADRNKLSYLPISSLLHAGDIAASTSAMQNILDDLVPETGDETNFSLLISITSIAAAAASKTHADGVIDLASNAVAVGDRALGLVEQINASDISMAEPERQEAQVRLNRAFSDLAAVARSLSQGVSLDLPTRDPSPMFRFRPDETGEVTASSPARSARISEARFQEACARVGWKPIPTPLEVDFGLDYRIEIPEIPDRTSPDVEFLVQLKSTSAEPNTSGFLTVSVKETTLKYWNSKVLPTLVVLFHHRTDTFYTSWYLPALDDTTQRTFRFARDDEWDPIGLRTDVQRYYRHMRIALASGGDWSVLPLMQSHCALLIKLLLVDPWLRKAALDPDAALSGAKIERTTLMLLHLHHRVLSGPLPILSGQPKSADIVKLLRTLDAIVRSWTLSGPQTSDKIEAVLVATHVVFKSARDLLHVAVELDCVLALAIVESQDARSAAPA